MANRAGGACACKSYDQGAQYLQLRLMAIREEERVRVRASAPPRRPALRTPMARSVLLPPPQEVLAMLQWALTFFVLALIAGVVGLTGLAGAAANIAWILFVAFIVLMIVAAVANAVRGSPPV